MTQPDDTPANTPAARPRAPVRSLIAEAILGVAKRRLSRVPIEGALRITLPDGRCVSLGQPGDARPAELTLNSFRLISGALRRGSLAFAESYISGDIETPDLIDVFQWFLANQDALTQAGGGMFRVRLPDRVRHWLRPNTRGGSRRNISEHYDLGNDFYRLWLDGTMTYSSGYFRDGANSLEAAQTAKYAKVMELLDAMPGHEILEIGCGWGGFAETAARADARVTGITLSHEQLKFARERVAGAGLDDACTFRLEDYRDTDARFDRVASIEMIEAVGEANWPVYFRTIADKLRQGGIAAVQAITIAEHRFEQYRAKVDFIQRYVFPGGMLPTARHIAERARAAGLSLTETLSFGECYAVTLAEWRRRFHDNWHQIERLGFDDRFRRKWDYYLAYCEAGFRSGTIDVGIYRLEKA